ncbi:MAG: hypothetical protein IJ033_04870 [Clostridia bacterium]|nr:hypothetical protein [Clostridia bacterium]
MAKILNSRNIMLVVAAILVIVLLVATILVSIKPKTDYKGVLDYDKVVKTDSVIYSLETENTFKAHVSKFLENMLASFFDSMEGFEGARPTIKNSSAISTPILTIFSKSAIPSDKLLNFGEYLRNMNTDDAVMDIWLFFIKPVENPDGTVNGRFATNAELAEMLLGEVDFGYAITDVVENTALTAEEVGRVLYELIYVLGDEEQQALLGSVGRGSFVNLFVATTTIYEGYLEFSLSGGTLSEARVLGELAFEMGAELDALIDEVGVPTILGALYLNSNTAVDNSALKKFLTQSGVDTSTLADVDEVNTALRAGINLSEFSLYFLRTALMEMGNQPFESLSIYYSGEKENARDYLYMYHVSLARAVAKGIDSALSSGTIIKDKDSLIQGLANFKLTAEEVAGDIANPDARKSELREYFASYLDALESLNSGFSSVESVEDIALLSASDYQKLQELSAFMVDFNYNELTVGTDELLSTLCINVAFNVFSDIANEALGNVNAMA